ncbi:hypothetical protein [Amycolatopsis sp. Poz14]|uniref:hypothetical protein n=1 Tax=Amycolatopsis sp. Poz14 TaxID=1447705 RepID=UPI001EE78FCA|nr:hypothetical protein [Amycolatopsis sp. Poz14]MCG3757384.1 hypothetical protein [Amycolatopsis sp. Poz14]
MPSYRAPADAAGLTDEQIRAVLAAAMGYDNRRPGDLNVAAWREASQVGRWTLGEAVEAVHQHYATQTDFLMPGHVTQRIKAARRTAPLPAERQLPTAPPAEPERVRAAVAEIGARLGWPERNTTASDPELSVVCPHERCRAGKHRPCGYRLTRGAHAGEWRPIRGYHPSRTKAAQQKEADHA